MTSWSVIKIGFKRSPAVDFDFIIQEAQKSSCFIEADASGMLSASYDRNRILELHRLLERLKRFRNKIVFVDGERLPWSEVFGYLWCYRLRDKAANKDEYCHGCAWQFPALNPWGCIQAKMPLAARVQWLLYGHFDKDGTFIFNKEKIRSSLLANIEEFRFCPALDRDRIEKILAAFPETANPQIDKNWMYVGPIDKSLVVNIRIFSGIDKQDFVGVCPFSLQASKNIYQKIIRKIQK